MQIYNDLSEIKKDIKTVITLGTFDGIHLGHQKIINRLKEKAVEIGGRNFLITFHPHPRKIVSGNSNLKLLTTNEEKTQLLKDAGIENLFVINFTREFSTQSPETFVKKYLVDSIGVKEVVIGYNHHFGKGRGGDAQTLKELGTEFGFSVTTIDAFRIDDNAVSSTSIRNALYQGDISLANQMLGRYYSFSGIVVPGDKRGRKLGFPTANLKIDDVDKLIPAIGIYVVKCFLNDEIHYGLLSIGRRPTFHNSGEIVAEVYLFDFNRDIYQNRLTVNVISRLRGEIKFDSAEELVAQMNKDRNDGLSIIRNLNN
ncbi:MAG: bifunctional riboflavin kinase/FAD synthetase [Ignavibacteriaceae bacterium]